MAESKTNKLKTSINIYNRLLWDDTLALDKDQIEIIHHDKYQRLKSMAFNDWKSIDQGGDIPFHRIAQFKYNGYILWDRKQKIDNINKGSGKSTIDFQSIQQSVYQSSSGNDNSNDEEDDHNNDNIVNNTIVAEQDLNNYIDPMNSSEYVADTQFLNLLKMEPKSVSLLYQTLNDMIDNTFISQRPNDIEILARKLCFKYLSYIDTMKKQDSYYLFGSATMGLDTHKSDLDIKIISSKDNKISNREQCVQLLTEIKDESLRLNKLKYILKQNGNTNEINDNHIIINMEDLKSDIDDDEDIKLMELQNNIDTLNKMIDSIIVRISSIEIADGVIPRLMQSFEIKVQSKKSVVMEFNISMDITVSMDKTGIEQMRDKHLANWVNKYCVDNDDKRIHKFLFCVKLWAQHFKINESTSSTINGYGWIHIALFLLTNNYKQMNTGDNENGNKYESMYPDIDIPKDISNAKLFILFIAMLYKWVCFDETKYNQFNLEKILRPGMNIISGQWIHNIKQYALFVLDPFCQSGHLPDNLAKCVRNKRGIPLIIKAIKSSVQQLQFGADEAVKQNKDAISKHIEFFIGNARSINSKQDEFKEYESKQQDDDNNIEYVSWKQLQSLNLNMPKRKWIQHSSIGKDDKIITICQFNCLAQELTSGTSERTTFRTDKKYLTWNYRSKRILYEILQYKPDIICLCEVDAIHFKDFYYPNLSKSSFKYEGVYLNKNNPNKHKTSSNQRRRSPKDGCAIFWNSNKFSCHDKFECILGKPKRAYHIALAVRLTYKIKNNISSQFDVWSTHLKAGRNNKAEEWRLSQVNTLLYYMRKFSNEVPILFCGDLNAHFEPLINDQGDIVDSKVYPAILNGKINSKSTKNSNKTDNNEKKKRDNYVLKFDSVWNNDTRNTWSTYAGWCDRDVKCCLDYIMIGNWHKNDKINNYHNPNNDDRMFKVRQLLDVWDEQKVQKFDCKLPNQIYPSDHLLIGAKIAIKTDPV